MHVWTHIKKPRMLLYQCFGAFLMNIVYTSFYTGGVNIDIAAFLLPWFILHFA